MNEETKRNLIWAIAITSMVLGLFTFLSILSFPARWTIEIEMDNNTREAISSINYTAISNNQDKPNMDVCSVPYEWFNSNTAFTFKQENGVCYWLDYPNNTWRIMR